MTLKSHTIVIGLLMGLVINQSGVAQLDEPAGPNPGDLTISLLGGYEHQFDADLDSSDGEFNVDTVIGGVNLNTYISDTFQISLGYNYVYDDYDFSGTTGLGSMDPWEDISTQRLRLLLNFQFSNDWSMYAGPVAIFAKESGASSSDSDTYGGAVGFTYTQSTDLTFGIGVVIIDQIEDDVRVFPSINLNWNFGSSWKLTSFSNAQRAGLEVVYEFDQALECALGVGYQYSRFRLDDSGFAPDGVGEVSGVPLFFRVGWKPEAELSLNAFAGVQLGGELEIDNSKGSKLRDDDFDPAFIAGASITFRF